VSYQTTTHLYRLDPAQPDPALLTLAADVLRRGGLVAFPTETVYGLGANARDAEAVARIFAAKGRPASDPIIVHIHDQAQLAVVARDLPPLAETLAAAFWPGPLTLVLRRSDHIPSIVSSGLPTVAVRMPSGAVARALLRAADLPIAAPSANTFSRPSATTAAHVLEDLDGRVDVILDAGPTQIGIESTVLDLTGETPTVLRPGGVTIEALHAHTPVILHERFIDAKGDESAPAPGMLLRHYAPRAPLTLFEAEPSAAVAAMRAQAVAAIARGQRIGLLIVDEDRAALADLGAQIETLGSERDLAQVSARLFAGLRALDAAGVDAILARTLGSAGLGAAIRDRLLRAAEGRVVRG
jgi:L-threonylcarbamoyladenylate synthase